MTDADILREQILSGTCDGTIRYNFLDLSGTDIKVFPENVSVDMRLDLSGCSKLEKLPDNLTTGSLILRDCTALETLPKNLSVTFLDLDGCSSLKALPDDVRIDGGRLNVRGCVWLDQLPDNLGEVSELDISRCLNITRLPKGLRVSSWIDIAGSGVDIASLPEDYKDVGFRWHRVSVPSHVIREPEKLTTDQILNETNAEVRRVMMERFGYERLFDETNAEVLDRDRDRGGERRLLRIALEGDEDLVCVYVACPSTGHKFVLRVPPDMKTCHQAVAWTAGFDDPSLYRPVLET